MVGAVRPPYVPTISRSAAPPSVHAGSLPFSTCSNDGAVSSWLLGSATQVWMPCMRKPVRFISGSVRSLWAMPLPAATQFTSPWRIWMGIA